MKEEMGLSGCFATAERHAVLRMRYGPVEGGEGVRQWAVPIEEWVLPVREVDAEDERAAERAVDEEVGTPIELEVTSVRLLVVHLVGTEEHIVVLNVHHIATDGWSTGLLTECIVLAYNALLVGEDVPERESGGIQYADYAVWQRELLKDEGGMSVHHQYWCDVLSGELPVLELQADHARPAVMTTHGASVPVSVDLTTAEALGSLCRSCGYTVMRGVLGAWALLLGKQSGQEEVVVGIPYANREHPATHGVVGYFVNTLAIRVGVDGARCFRDVVRATG